ncbi:MAG TPA: heme exporter protein CcmB [bacterium]|nr:heme exporter protein CcmB [bacterium]
MTAIRLLVWKDLVLELRTKEILTAMAVFSMLVAVVFGFAFSPSPDDAVRLLPGMLWVTLVFAATMGLSRSFVLEREQECLEGLRLFPIDRSAIYIGKALANLVFLFAVEVLLLPALAAISGVSLLPRLFPLLAVLVLGTIGLVAVGTLFSAMSVHTRIREVLLPVLMLPLAAPVLISGTKAMQGLLAGRLWADVLPGIRILGAFDVIFGVIGYLVFEYVLEE